VWSDLVVIVSVDACLWLGIQQVEKHIDILKPEGAMFMSLRGQFYMSPDNCRFKPDYSRNYLVKSAVTNHT
jgi:hypothetical protein